MIKQKSNVKSISVRCVLFANLYIEEAYLSRIEPIVLILLSSKVHELAFAAMYPTQENRHYTVAVTLVNPNDKCLAEPSSLLKMIMKIPIM